MTIAAIKAHKMGANPNQIPITPIEDCIYGYPEYSIFFPHALNKQTRNKSHTVVTLS